MRFQINSSSELRLDLGVTRIVKNLGSSGI